MAIRFSNFKLDRDRGSDCDFGISSSLIVVAIGILFSKFFGSVSMECSNKISSSEDEFDLSLFEIISIHEAIDVREKESSNEARDEVRSVRRQKMRIIDGERESDSNTVKDRKFRTDYILLRCLSR